MKNMRDLMNILTESTGPNDPDFDEDGEPISNDEGGGSYDEYMDMFGGRPYTGQRYNAQGEPDDEGDFDEGGEPVGP